MNHATCIRAATALLVMVGGCATNEFDPQYGAPTAPMDGVVSYGDDPPASTEVDGGARLDGAAAGKDASSSPSPPIPTGTATDADAGGPPTMPAPGNVAGTNQGIMWGVNAHPIQSLSGVSVYATTAFSKQMQQLTSLGLRHYRMDLYGPSNDQYGVLTNVVAAAAPFGVVVTPALISKVGTSEDDSYQIGYAMGLGYSKKFSSDIHIWELGNEENGSIMDGFDDGSDPQTFKSKPGYPLKRGKLRGLIDGVRAGDPSAKVAVGDAGGCNYGFTQALWDDGLRWDITLFHPYDFWGAIDNRGSTGVHCAQGDNMLAKHAVFGKPIWLTEFNWTPPIKSGDKVAMGTGIINMMTNFNRLAQQYDIEEADVYELYDEVAGVGAEAHFGIFDGATAPTSASVKIENYLMAHPSFVYVR